MSRRARSRTTRRVAADEALEKIRLGMWLFPREGTMRNLEALLPVILEHRPERACFVADDRPATICCGWASWTTSCGWPSRADSIRCAPSRWRAYIQRSILASRIAAPSRRVFAPIWSSSPISREFRPSQVYVGGVLVAEDGESLFAAPALPTDLTAKVSDTIRLANFGVERLRLPGYSGAARVIGMIPNQIVTEDLTLEVRRGTVISSPILSATS